MAVSSKGANALSLRRADRQVISGEENATMGDANNSRLFIFFLSFWLNKKKKEEKFIGERTRYGITDDNELQFSAEYSTHCYP